MCTSMAGSNALRHWPDPGSNRRPSDLRADARTTEVCGFVCGSCDERLACCAHWLDDSVGSHSTWASSVVKIFGRKLHSQGTAPPSLDRILCGHRHWPGPGSSRKPSDLWSDALPTELSGHLRLMGCVLGSVCAASLGENFGSEAPLSGCLCTFIARFSCLWSQTLSRSWIEPRIFRSPV